MTVSIFASIVTLVALGQNPQPKDDTLGLKPPQGAKVLFDGKTLSEWTTRDGAPAPWIVKEGEYFSVAPGKGDIVSKEKFGNFQLHIEFNVPYMPKATGQGRGNSGIYLGGLYELQVLDSYGLKLQNNDCGAIYQQIVPSVNVCKPPLQWQTYDVTLHAAKVEADKVIKKARVTVLHNGVKTIDDKEITISPGGAGGNEGEPGGLLLQDHGNDVEYRNIWVVPLP